jgi:hypothetical protein
MGVWVCFIICRTYAFVHVCVCVTFSTSHLLRTTSSYCRLFSASLSPFSYSLLENFLFTSTHIYTHTHTHTHTHTQRFCQSYMTELSKYIGPDIDLPGLGNGVNAPEIG